MAQKIRYAGTFLLILDRIIKRGKKVRYRKIVGEPSDKNKLEWILPDEIGLKCYRKTCAEFNISNCEETIAKIIEDGGFVERFSINNWEKWILNRMVHHKLLDDKYQITDFGKKIHKEQFRKYD